MYHLRVWSTQGFLLDFRTYLVYGQNTRLVSGFPTLSTQFMIYSAKIHALIHSSATCRGELLKVLLIVVRIGH